MPAPAIVALHDHGGMYFWGKEKLVETADEHPVAHRVQADSVRGQERRLGAGQAGLRRDRHRHVLLGRASDAAGRRPGRLARPARARSPAERVAAFNRRAGQNEQLVGRTIYSAGFTWSGVMFWDDVRTVDYLITRPEVDPRPDRLRGAVGRRPALLPPGGARRPDQGGRRGRLDDLVPGPAEEAHQPHDRPHEARARPDATSSTTPTWPRSPCPPALLVINGSQDTLFDLDGVRASFAKLAACYKKAGIAREAPRPGSTTRPTSSTPRCRPRHGNG